MPPQARGRRSCAGVDAPLTAAAPAVDRQLVGGGCFGYGLMPYRPKSATETTTWPLVSPTAQKRHLSLYVCAVDEAERSSLVRDAVAATRSGSTGCCAA